MFSKEFLDLTQSASEKTNNRYKQGLKDPNPYYLGFGNPNSTILLVGQEMAIDTKDSKKIKAESIDNPLQWKTILEKKITDFDYRFYEDYHFQNPLKPYSGPAKHTWRNYEKLLEIIQSEKYSENLEFFKNCFLTEINTTVSKTQKGYISDEERIEILKHEFFKTFTITILATGNYLKPKPIEEIFNVKYSKENSDSQPHKKFAVYYSDDKNRILINTRQLSNFRISGEEVKLYFQKIANQVK